MPGQIAFWDSTDALLVRESGVEERLRKSLPLVSGVRLWLTRRDAPQPAGAAVRFPRDPSMPWRVDASAAEDGSSSSARELFYFSSIGLVLAVSLLASGLMYRAVRREINRPIDQQAFTRAANDIFLGSAGLFLLLIGLIWLTKRPARSAGAGAADAGGAH